MANNENVPIVEPPYGVLPAEAFYVFRTGGKVWASEIGAGKKKHLLRNAWKGESHREKWTVELDRLAAEGVKEPIQFWVQ